MFCWVSVEGNKNNPAKGTDLKSLIDKIGWGFESLMRKESGQKALDELPFLK